MKKFAIIIAFICTNIAVQAQWEPQNSGTTHQLNSVCFIDTLNGWVSGGWFSNGWHGVILHTEDGGETWEEQNSGIEDDILSIYFTNSSHGWAGSDYSLYRTINGGITWENAESFKGFAHGICFSDSHNGWAVGSPNWFGNLYGGEISQSNDGGITWITQLELDPSNGGLYSVCFTDSLNGWVSGGDANGSTGFWDAFVLHTSDGGNNWTYQFDYHSRYGYILYDIYFTDTLYGWSVGGGGTYQRGIILKTTDGGNNWDTSFYDTLYGTFGFKAVSFADSYNGWAVGENGRIISTSDGGNTWVTNQSGIDQNLNCVFFTENGHGWAVGDSGTILHADYSQIFGQDEFRISFLKLDARVYPNPFTTSTTLSYTLEKPENVQITFYNLQGQIVERFEMEQPNGEQQFQWNAEGLPAGLYIIRLEAGNDIAYSKLLLAP